MNLGLKSTFPRLCNTVVKKRELIIEEVHIQTCRAACPPYVVPAFRHKQYMNLSSLWFLLPSLCAILSVRTTVHYRARRGEWRKTILSRKLICAVIPF